MNKNSGFSLIELLVTIAISSVVILMISFIMVQGTTLFKGENEAIDIQGEMQIVRNHISETLMGAKNLVIVEVDDGIVIYTGEVNKENNTLKEEGKVTTERIIAFKESGTDDKPDAIYISTNKDMLFDEGSLISNYVTDFSISIDDDCIREGTNAEGKTEKYYVNPLSINVQIKLAHGKQEADINMTVRARNILTEVAYYKVSDINTLLKNVTGTTYKVK